MVNRMYIKNYPWLDSIYKNIINNYLKGKLHHSIIITSYNINNTYKLIWLISKKILCSNQSNKIHACNQCPDCMLMKYKNHPDLHVLHSNNILEIEKIKKITNIIKNTSQCNQNKIIWITNYNLLNIFGINALLKIIEEPPQNTFFFIGNHNQKKIQLTFKSRCLLYNVSYPNEQIGLKWIQNNIHYDKSICLTELRSNNFNPELTLKNLNEKVWLKKKKLYHRINQSIDNNNLLILLKYLNDNDIITNIYWIILLLLDSLKFKKKMNLLINNTNEIHLIQKISHKYSFDNLKKILSDWIKCQYNITNIQYINSEIIICRQLVKWNIIHHQ